jgi:hypothetical protein
MSASLLGGLLVDSICVSSKKLHRVVRPGGNAYQIKGGVISARGSLGLLCEVSILQKVGYAELLGQLTETNLQLHSKIIQDEDLQSVPEASDISSSCSGVLEDYVDSFKLRPESPREMGYEQLLEHGERIGCVNIGLDDAQIKSIRSSYQI